jgi:O-acetyl-ADP-ribose deacetylase (regulator of RNase III)
MEHARMIRVAHGNLLDADVEALVNTVNTVGVMGKGIALQFKRAYPAMFKAYARAAKTGQIALGQMHVWETGQLDGPRVIVNFPTKGHWKSGSKLADIERGLDALVEVIASHGIRSIAVPPLGCGNGGLRWADVEPLIQRKLGQLPGVEVLVYPPEGPPSAAAMVTRTRRPRMTHSRAAVIALLDEYTRYAGEEPTLVEVQKLTYFLQEAGEPLKLDFVGHHYGPYADNLRHALVNLEGHYLSGFGDGSRPVHEAEPISLLPGAEESARAALTQEEVTAERVQRVLHLVAGFESPYGLELLATAHWVWTHTSDTEDVVNAVRAWSPRKEKLFTERDVTLALDTLAARGWGPRTPVMV